MDVTQILMLITILVYLAAMVGIGAVLAKQNQTTDDFYLGGRTLGPLVTAMSAEASDMSSWLLMGLPGVAYLSGTADAAWTAIGLAIGTYVNWLVVAKRLRNYTHVCGNSTTLPLFFSNRYRDNKRILSVIAALLIIIFFVPYCFKYYPLGVQYYHRCYLSPLTHQFLHASFYSHLNIDMLLYFQFF